MGDRVQDAVDTLTLADVWDPAIDTDGGIREGAWVAEATGLVNLSSWPAGTRLILRREHPHPGAQLRTLRAEVRHWARQRSKESASRAYNTPFACWRRQAAGGRMGNVEVWVYDRDRQRTFQLKMIVQMACHRQRARTYTHIHTHRTRTTNQYINQASKHAIKQPISDHDHGLAPAAPFPGATAVLGGGSRPRKTRKRRSNGLMRRIRGTKTARHRSRWSRGSTRFC